MTTQREGGEQGGLWVMAASALALLCANVPGLDTFYAHIGHTQFSLGLLSFPLHFAVNDGLMAIFFFVVASEIRHEVTGGALSSLKSVLLPAAAALGGVIAPAAIFIALSPDNSVAQSGWAIPSATDIAFSLAVLSLLGSRVPTALKVFLMTIAVADDLIAIVIIALFYGGALNGWFLVLALGLVALMALARRTGGGLAVITWLSLSAGLWGALLQAGLHTTLAGVAVGLLLPERALLAPLGDRSFGSWVKLTVDGAILPLFAFLNAGVVLTLSGMESESLQLSGSILFGLVLGKPLGIGLTCALLLSLGVAELPKGVKIREIWGIAMLAGIGFTMSLFISNLSFGTHGPQLLDASRIGIFSGSLLAAMLGLLYLSFVLPRLESRYVEQLRD